MSFSFSARGGDKAAAKSAVSAELAKVVEAQPVHKHDALAVQATADAYIDLLPDDSERDVVVSAHGSLCWEGSGDAVRFTSAGVGVSAYLANRE